MTTMVDEDNKSECIVHNSTTSDPSSLGSSENEPNVSGEAISHLKTQSDCASEACVVTERGEKSSSLVPDSGDVDIGDVLISQEVPQVNGCEESRAGNVISAIGNSNVSAAADVDCVNGNCCDLTEKDAAAANSAFEVKDSQDKQIVLSNDNKLGHDPQLLTKQNSHDSSSSASACDLTDAESDKVNLQHSVYSIGDSGQCQVAVVSSSTESDMGKFQSNSVLDCDAMLVLKTSNSSTPVKQILQNTDDTDILLQHLETELGSGQDVANRRKSKSSSSQEDVPGSLSASTSRSSLTEGGIAIGEDRYKLLFDHYDLQIELLERKNAELQHELAVTKEKVHAQEEELQNRSSQAKSDMVAHIEKLTKQVECTKRDLESMVVRYAQSEREAIIHKKAREELEKRLRDAAKEREGIINKLKVLSVERARVCSSLDNKLAEVASIQKDNEWLKEEVNSRDIKIKWLQNKLKTEADAHKECQLKLEQMVKRLNETKEEALQIRKECQSMVQHYQQAEEMKANQKKQEEAQRNESRDHDCSGQDETSQLKQELEAVKRKHKVSVDENNALTVKIQSLERDRLDYEQTVSKLKEFQISLQQEIADLNNKLVETESLKMQLQREKEKVTAAQKEVSRLKMTNAELQADVEACHSKEGELLEFTEKLTAKTVMLQSEHSLLEVKAQNLEQQLSKATKKCVELESQRESLQKKLKEMQQQHEKETQLLARKLAEKTKAAECLNTKLAEAKGENNVIMRRHVASIKELTRELHYIKKKLGAYESQSGTASADTPSLSSRTSSMNSLDMVNSHQVNHALSVVTTPVNIPASSGHAEHKLSTTKDTDNSGPPEISKQMLIERIGVLQKSMARKNEKIEFLKELVNQLQSEIKKKTRIIQNYILREEAGTLTVSTRDRNLAELARRGGVIPTSYSLQAPDSSMTLELSLEINSKLQAVLEDMILKNITLKDSINTLGEEIARMSRERNNN